MLYPEISLLHSFHAFFVITGCPGGKASREGRSSCLKEQSLNGPRTKEGKEDTC